LEKHFFTKAAGIAVFCFGVAGDGLSDDVLGGGGAVPEWVRELPASELSASGVRLAADGVACAWRVVVHRLLRLVLTRK
jgi:hypothetical protein